jgi:hypothetical protein
MPPCPGTLLPTTTNTPCVGYGVSCPGTHVPIPTIVTPSHPVCTPWWSMPQPIYPAYENTPCGWNSATQYVCFPPCPGASVATPANTACAPYVGACPGTRIPGIPFSYPVYTPTSGVGTPTCGPWWASSTR